MIGVGQILITTGLVSEGHDETMCESVVQLFGAGISASFEIFNERQAGTQGAEFSLDGLYCGLRSRFIELEQYYVPINTASFCHKDTLIVYLIYFFNYIILLRNRFRKPVSQGKSMKITISDIAKQAGVSKATVSRVLNHHPEGVGAEKRAQIQAILNETGFQPSGFARGLATGKSHSIGLIIPNITNPFYPLLVRGVEDVLNRAGYSLFLCNSDGNLVKEKEYVRVLLEKGVDGVILNSAASNCDCHLSLLDSQGVPHVTLERIIEGQLTSYGVFLDNREGARLATRYLLSQEGCRLAYLNGPAEHSQSKLRRAGLEDVLSEKGFPLASVSILQGDDSIQSGQLLIGEALDNWEYDRSSGRLPFNAVFAGNDLMAVGAMQALKLHNTKVPDEVQIIGFDDIELAQLVEPALSTVSQPTFEMGSRSAELLLQLISGKKPRSKTVIMKPTLVLRGTTKNLSIQ